MPNNVFFEASTPEDILRQAKEQLANVKINPKWCLPSRTESIEDPAEILEDMHEKGMEHAFELVSQVHRAGEDFLQSGRSLPATSAMIFELLGKTHQAGRDKPAFNCLQVDIDEMSERISSKIPTMREAFEEAPLLKVTTLVPRLLELVSDLLHEGRIPFAMIFQAQLPAGDRGVVLYTIAQWSGGLCGLNTHFKLPEGLSKEDLKKSMGEEKTVLTCVRTSELYTPTQPTLVEEIHELLPRFLGDSPHENLLASFRRVLTATRILDVAETCKTGTPVYVGEKGFVLPSMLSYIEMAREQWGRSLPYTGFMETVTSVGNYAASVCELSTKAASAVSVFQLMAALTGDEMAKRSLTEALPLMSEISKAETASMELAQKVLFPISQTVDLATEHRQLCDLFRSSLDRYKDLANKILETISTAAEAGPTPHKPKVLN